MGLRINIDLEKYRGAEIRRLSPGIIVVQIPKSFAILREFGFNADYQKVPNTTYCLNYEGIAYRVEAAGDAMNGFEIRCIEHVEGL